MPKDSQSLKPLGAVLGATLALGVAGVASASPFSANKLQQGYRVVDMQTGGHCDSSDCDCEKNTSGKACDGKCAAGKCGAKSSATDKSAQGKCAAGKCGAGKCGANGGGTGPDSSIVNPNPNAPNAES